MVLILASLYTQKSTKSLYHDISSLWLAENILQSKHFIALNSSFTKISYIDLPPVPRWRSLLELSEVLSLGLQSSFQFSSVQSLSCVWLFATPWIAACQASLSVTNSRSLFKLMSIKLVMDFLSSVIPFSSCLQSFPASGSFPMSQFFTSGSQSIGFSALASVLSKNIQDWFPLGWTGWISLQSKGLSRVFSNTTVQKHQFFGTQLSL